MLVGAIVGWILTARTVPLPPSWRRPLLVSGVAAVTAGLSTAALSRLLVDAGIWLSFVGAVGCALACTAVFVAVVFVGDRPLLRQVLALRRRQPELVQP
jgi:hypothetical protein